MNQSNNLFNQAIPQIKELEMWEKYDFINSPFIEIPHTVKMDKITKIIVDMQYPKRGMQHSIEKCLIRKEALERLLIACTYLPQELSFKIWDVYRTWNLQNELYYAYKPEIIKQFNLQNLSLEKQEKIISNYVSIPNKNEILPRLHTTGGSIDLTITDLRTNKDLEFGIEFDDFSDLTNTAFYEKEDLNEIVKANRRLLYNIMTQSGFTNLPSEVWHYDYGNRAWGYYENKPAIYKGIFTIDKMPLIISFEEFIKILENDNSSKNSIELRKHQWN